MATKLQYNPLSGRMEEVDMNDFVYKFRGENTPTVDAQPASAVVNTDLDTGGLASEGWGDKFSRWFTPNDKGFSTGGTFMDAFGKGAQGTAAIGGLAAEYLNYKADKKQAKWEKEKEENALKLTADRQAKVDQAGIDLSRNVGNGASYSYKPTVG